MEDLPPQSEDLGRNAAGILLADDDKGELESALGGSSYDVVTARSGQEALALVLKREFAVVVLDVRMPDMDGFETARLLRARPATRHLPIILLTGCDLGPKQSAEAYELGVVDIVTKPVRPEVLRTKVGVFVELYDRARQARVAQARYDSLAVFAPVGVFHADAQGNCVWVNPRWCELAGISASEACGHGWTKALHPEDRERVSTEWYQAAKGAGSFRSEYRFLRPDHRVSWVLGQAKEDRDSAGRVSGYVGTVTDISAEKRTRDDLGRLVEERTRELGRAHTELKLITDTVPVLISSVGKDERYVRVNRTYERWFGKRPEEVEGKHLREVLGEKAYQAVLPQVRSVLSGHEVSFEAAIPYEGAGTRHVRASYIPIKNSDGEGAGYVALVEDISEAKRAIEALRESEAALSDFFENGAVGCHWVGPDGTILRVNRTELEMMGYSADEYIGKNIAEFHVDQPVIHDVLRRLSAGEILHDVPARMLAKGGSIKHVLIDSSVRWVENQFIHTRCFTRDVSEHRRLQEERDALLDREREARRYAEVLNEVGKAIAAELDLDKLLQTVTDAATRLTGAQFGAFFYNVKNEKGESYMLYTLSGVPRERFANFPMPRNTPLFGPTFRGEGTIRFDDVRKDSRYGKMGPHHGTPPGHLPVVSYLATPVVSRSKEVIGGLFFGHSDPGQFLTSHERLVEGLAAEAAIAVINARLYRELQQELDTRRRAEEEIRRLNTDLERRVRERTAAFEETAKELEAFAYTVAHDLRAPLRTVHTFGEMLLEESAQKLDESQREYLDRMVGAAGRMDSLITDLLSYTRIHRQEVTLQEVDLNVVVTKVLEDLRLELAAKGAVVNVSESLPTALGHGLLLNQALVNLVSNAVKFVEAGTQPRIRIAAEKMDGRVRLWVEDNGIGIAPEHQGKLFNVFERIHAGTEYPGTGIGLAIVRRAAERMSGRAGVESAEGRGSRFWIELGHPKGSTA